MKTKELINDIVKPFKVNDTAYLIIDNKLEKGTIKRIETIETEKSTYTRCSIVLSNGSANDIEMERLYRTRQELINNL